jgi:hypothetical protein
MAATLKQAARGTPRIWRGIPRLFDYAVVLVDKAESHLIFATFYLVASLLFTILQFSLPPTITTGLDAIQQVFGIPYWITVAVFQFCGFVLAQRRNHYVYMICVAPAILYAIGVGYGTWVGIINTLGSVATLYILTLAILGIKSIRAEFQYAAVRQSLNLANERLAKLENDIDPNS